MVRHDDAAVRTCRLSTFLSQHNIVFHIKGQDDTALSRSKEKLLPVCGSSMTRFLGGHAIKASLAEDLCQQWVYIFVEIECYGCDLTCCSQLASRSC